jgi:RHS repeat-associated protein
VTDKNSSGTTLQVVANSYDMFNDLIGRTLTPYSGGVAGTPVTARFVYDLASGGSVVAGSPDLTAGGGPSAGSGQGNAVLAFNGNESLTDRYLWGPAVDQILADERFAPTGSNQMPSSVGTTYWALTDNENSVRDWITYGSLVDHIVYDSFGKIYSQSSTAVPFAFMHNGVFYDPATGLEYHSQSGTGVPGRWYNPALKRWMSEDPTGLGADSNPYRDVYNSPTNFIDPSGHRGALGGQEGLLGGQEGLLGQNPDGNQVADNVKNAWQWQHQNPDQPDPQWVTEAIAAYGGFVREEWKKYLADRQHDDYVAYVWEFGGAGVRSSYDEFKVAVAVSGAGIVAGIITNRITGDGGGPSSQPEPPPAEPPPAVQPEEPFPPPGPEPGTPPLGGGTTSSGGWFRWGPGRGPGGNPITGDVPPTPWYPPPAVTPPIWRKLWGPPFNPN